MAAGEIPAPGTKHGPCVGACKHKDCAASREDAATECLECCKAIDYGVLFYRDGPELVHAACVEVVRDRVKARGKSVPEVAPDKIVQARVIVTNAAGREVTATWVSVDVLGPYVEAQLAADLTVTVTEKRELPDRHGEARAPGVRRTYPCTVPGCRRASRVNGGTRDLCGTHQKAKDRTGSPLGVTCSRCREVFERVDPGMGQICDPCFAKNLEVPGWFDGYERRCVQERQRRRARAS